MVKPSTDENAVTSPDSQPRPCCAPRAERARDETSPGALDAPQFQRIRQGDTEGMKLLKGGSFVMGTDQTYGFAADGEGPAHAVKLAPFWIDATCVTNAQFTEFVNATGFRTEAEQFGWSFVFEGQLDAKQRQTAVRGLVLGSEWWCRVDGATWRHPEGPGSNIKARWDHPVVHVSWNDARAYAAWAGKRLPTEAEWEYAARGGLVGARFPWGDELEPEGRHRMNVWQGTFPTHNTAADGYAATAPAWSFKANGYGLYNMTGNVWEWCWDWFNPNYYRASPTDNPTGPLLLAVLPLPDSTSDSAVPTAFLNAQGPASANLATATGGERRVLRGGSYLCHASYCNRYRVDARSANTPDSSTSNTGFRCVRDDAAF